MNLRALVDNKDKLVLPNIPLPPPPSTKTPSPNLARLSPFLRSLIIARQQNVLDRGVLEEGRTRCRRALCWLIHFPSFTIKTTSRMKRADSSGVVFCVKIQRWRAEAVENFLLLAQNVRITQRKMWSGKQKGWESWREGMAVFVALKSGGF